LMARSNSRRVEIAGTVPLCAPSAALFMYNCNEDLTNKKKQTNKLRGLSPRANYTDRRLSAKLVPTFADRWCHVVSVTGPYGRILGFLNR
jgi:hypothetical protein